MAGLYSEEGTFVVGSGKSHTVRYARPFARKPRLQLYPKNETMGGNYGKYELADEQHDSFTFANTGKRDVAQVRWKATGEPQGLAQLSPQPRKSVSITAILGGIAALIATAWTCIQIYDWYVGGAK